MCFYYYYFVVVFMVLCTCVIGMSSTTPVYDIFTLSLQLANFNLLSNKCSRFILTISIEKTKAIRCANNRRKKSTHSHLLFLYHIRERAQQIKFRADNKQKKTLYKYKWEWRCQTSPVSYDHEVCFTHTLFTS